jgi:hypothetical protein
MGKSDQDNRSNQLNPNNPAYWQSRGEEERPKDWGRDDRDKAKGSQQPAKI